MRALHGAAAPDGLRSWTPRVGPDFADEVRVHTAEPWTSGPLAEQARVALAAHSWVPTHASRTTTTRS